MKTIGAIAYRAHSTRLLLIVGCLVVVAIGFLMAYSQRATSGTETLRAKLSDYEATLIMRPYDPAYDQGFWYGAELSEPNMVVQSLEVRYKGESCFPRGRGVYSDLAEVNRMWFQRLKDGKVRLVIEGGDAADGYRAYLTFKGGQLVQRRVENGEFPQNFYEETRYVNIPVRD